MPILQNIKQHNYSKQLSSWMDRELKAVVEVVKNNPNISIALCALLVTTIGIATIGVFCAAHAFLLSFVIANLCRGLPSLVSNYMVLSHL